MSIDTQMDADCSAQTPDYGNQPELALLALLSMLSRYPFSPSACMADSIGRHFAYVAGEQRLSAPFRETAARLWEEWRMMTAEPAGAPSGTLMH